MVKIMRLPNDDNEETSNSKLESNEDDDDIRFAEKTHTVKVPFEFCRELLRATFWQASIY